MDAYLRAFDAKSGKELWQGRLPVPGVANPMTYLWNGEQYVVIAAGAIPKPAPRSATAWSRSACRALAKRRRCGRKTIDRPGGRFASSATTALLAIVLAIIGLWRLRRRRRANLKSAPAAAK